MITPPRTSAEAPLDGFAWPAARAADALEALARAAKLPLTPNRVPPMPASVDVHPERFGRWLELSGAWLGLDAAPVFVDYPEVASLVRGAAPALLRVRGAPLEACVIALAKVRGRTAHVVAPDGAEHRVPVARLASLLVHALEVPCRADIARVLDAAGIPARSRAAAGRSLLRARLRSQRIDGLWLVRIPAATSLTEQARRAGLLRRFTSFVIAYAASNATALVAFWMLGRAALEGRFDGGWLLAWGLLLVTQIPVLLYVHWAQAHLAVDAGALLKRRLLFGAVRMPTDAVRSGGAGGFLGRVLESESVEALALGAGHLVVAAAIELVSTAVVLILGGAAWSVVALGGWLVLSLAMAARYFARRRRWTKARVAMTHELVERMVGHRTRVAQLPRARWHDGEDDGLASYLDVSRAMDRAGVALGAAIPRGWLVLAIVALAPAFVGGSATPVSLAVGLGGALLGFHAFRRLAAGLMDVTGLVIAWESVAPLHHAAGAPHPPASPDVAIGEVGARDASGAAMERTIPNIAYQRQTDRTAEAAGLKPLVDMRGLSFRYGTRAKPVLEGCDLVLHAGDRVLLEGESGGGKSTLGSVLAGLREPQSGLLLLGGLDRRTLGSEGWRRRVASTPQFHENHVFSATVGFNLLMGRRWPPLPEDTDEAELICRELGLDDVLDRMPSGMEQTLGETGWQLSHGERSRVFVARTLLQDPDVVVFDESFAALDPNTLEQVLRCVFRRARTLVVIAHP